MIMRVAAALAYGILVALACLLGGQLLASLGAGPFDVIGHFLSNWAWILGLLAAVIAFYRGLSIPGIR